MTQSRRHLIVPIVAVCIALAAPRAEASPADFAVVRIDGSAAYVNIGKTDGVTPGQALEVIDQSSTETFHLGWIVVESVGSISSMARIPDELRTTLRPGTVVRMPPKPAPKPAPKAVAPVAPVAPPPQVPPAAPAFDPEVPTVLERPGYSNPSGNVSRVAHTPPVLVPPGVPLTLTAFVPEPFTNPVLMYRSEGEKAYKSMPFTAKPDSYFTAQVAAPEIQAPGFEYYIVVDQPGIARQLAFADPESPRAVGVEGRFNETNELARYGVRDEWTMMGELVSYRSRNGVTDYYTRVEGEYLHRIFKSVYSMRFGGGWLDGQALEAGYGPDGDELMKREVGFLYAYSEAEFRSAKQPFAFIPRLIFGVNNKGVGGGFQGRMRVGDELGMNFEAGITIVSEIGFETFTTLTVHPTSRLRLALSAHLEDLPLADTLGFRSYIEPRYRIRQGLWATLRLGVAARSIDTIGPDTGLGLALGF